MLKTKITVSVQNRQICLEIQNVNFSVTEMSVLLCVSLRINRCVLLQLEHVHSCQPVNHKCDLYDNGALYNICFEFFPLPGCVWNFLQ